MCCQFWVYTDLASSYLYVKAKITTAAGGNVGADIQVGPSNLWMHALFSQVEIFLNNNLVTPSSTAYPYRARYIETILNVSKNAKDSHLTSAVFYKDKAGKMDVVYPLAQDTNIRLKQRHAFTRESKSVAMEGRIHSDLFAQDRYILVPPRYRDNLAVDPVDWVFGSDLLKGLRMSQYNTRCYVNCRTRNKHSSMTTLKLGFSADDIKQNGSLNLTSLILIGTEPCLEINLINFKVVYQIVS
jgi:hypothetical protein